MADLTGVRILVAEDDYFIAAAIEGELIDLAVTSQAPLATSRR